MDTPQPYPYLPYYLPTPSVVDCVALEEPQCTMYHTTTGDTGPTAAANFANLIAVKDSSCYAETARWVEDLSCLILSYLMVLL